MNEANVNKRLLGSSRFLLASATSSERELPLHTAIDGEDLIGHVSCILACNEANNTSNIVDLCEPFKQDSPQDFLFDLFGNILEHIRLDESAPAGIKTVGWCCLRDPTPS